MGSTQRRAGYILTLSTLALPIESDSWKKQQEDALPSATFYPENGGTIEYDNTTLFKISLRRTENEPNNFICTWTSGIYREKIE
jgi:hypothetical protein